MKGFVIARVISAILLFWALGKHPYGYYTLLRFVVCGVSAYGANFSAQLRRNNWAWIFGIVALLFNPIIPIHLNRDIWAFIDSGVGVLFLVSLFVVRKQRE